jgi:hypothetical protein
MLRRGSHVAFADLDGCEAGQGCYISGIRAEQFLVCRRGSIELTRRQVQFGLEQPGIDAAGVGRDRAVDQPRGAFRLSFPGRDARQAQEGVRMLRDAFQYLVEQRLGLLDPAQSEMREPAHRVQLDGIRDRICRDLVQEFLVSTLHQHAARQWRDSLLFRPASLDRPAELGFRGLEIADGHQRTPEQKTRLGVRGLDLERILQMNDGSLMVLLGA